MDSEEMECVLANMISKVSRPAPRAKRRADSRLCRCSVAGPSPGIHLASTSDGGSVEADTVPLGTTIPGSRRSSAQGEGGERAGREGEGAAWRSSSIAMIQLSDLLDHSVAHRASFCTTFTSRRSDLRPRAPQPLSLSPHLVLRFISSLTRSLERWMLYQPRLLRRPAERPQHAPEQQQARMGRRTSGARFSTVSLAPGAWPPRIVSY